MRLMNRYVKHFLIFLALFMQTVSAQSVANPKVTYFHNDITGTAVAATDEKGEVIWREQRRAYGEIKVDPLKPKSLDEFSVGYTGHQADKESGLTYAKARYYNKAIGRFYAPDPIPFRESDLVSINRYAYAANNPYVYKDPDGMESNRIEIYAQLQGMTVEEYKKARSAKIKQLDNDVADVGKVALETAGGLALEATPIAKGADIVGKFLGILGIAKKAKPRMRLTDITKKRGKTISNYKMNCTQQEFEDHLLNNGFKISAVKEIKRDGVLQGKVKNYTKDNTKFSIRDFSKSGDRTVDVYRDGEKIAKGRFADADDL